jgi:hypothetical protein
VMHEDGYEVFNLRGGLRRLARDAGDT